MGKGYRFEVSGEQAIAISEHQEVVNIVLEEKIGDEYRVNDMDTFEIDDNTKTGVDKVTQINPEMYLIEYHDVVPSLAVTVRPCVVTVRDSRIRIEPGLSKHGWHHFKVLGKDCLVSVKPEPKDECSTVTIVTNGERYEFVIFQASELMSVEMKEVGVGKIEFSIIGYDHTSKLLLEAFLVDGGLALKTAAPCKTRLTLVPDARRITEVTKIAEYSIDSVKVHIVELKVGKSSVYVEVACRTNSEGRYLSSGIYRLRRGSDVEFMVQQTRDLLVNPEILYEVLKPELGLPEKPKRETIEL